MPTLSHRPTGAVAAALAVGLSLVVALLVTTFAWPAARSEPHQVPVAVVAPPDAAAPLVAALESGDRDAFDVERTADRGSAVERIEDREAYGAFVVTADGVEVLVASGASPSVAQLLTTFGERLGSETGAPVTVSDLAPGTSEDRRSAGLAAGSLPLVLAGIVIAAAASTRMRRVSAQLATALAAAALSGLSAVLVLDPWLGSVADGFWAASGVVALGIAAMAVTLVALRSALGLPGLAVGAATFVLLGNPLSGMTSAPELLPSGWGTLGQLLPPGAMGSALRSVSFFDGANVGGELLVLTGWLAGGLLLAAATAGRSSSGAPDPAVHASPARPM